MSSCCSLLVVSCSLKSLHSGGSYHISACCILEELFALQVDDELKKIKPKDPKLMTARQRAMFERKTDKEPSPGGEQLLALPSGKLTGSF